jgi:hypothetical protein
MQRISVALYAQSADKNILMKYAIMALQNSAGISNEENLKTVFYIQGAVQGNVVSYSYASDALIGFLAVILQYGQKGAHKIQRIRQL